MFKTIIALWNGSTVFLFLRKGEDQVQHSKYVLRGLGIFILSVLMIAAVGAFAVLRSDAEETGAKETGINTETKVDTAEMKIGEAEAEEREA